MQRFILGLAVVASFTLFSGSLANAKGGPASSSSSGRNFSVSGNRHVVNNHVQVTHLHQTHGPQVRHGNSFRLRQSNWTPRCWNRSYGCYCYYCPSECCYYYYCAPYQCYYPVSYCPTGSYGYEEGGY